MTFLKETLKLALRWGILVYFSIAAAFTLRILWLLSIRALPSGSDYGALFSQAFKDSFLPTTLILLLFEALRRLLFGSAKTRLTRDSSAVGLLSAFFGTMLLLAWSWPAWVAFPQKVLPLAWAISLTTYFGWRFTRSIRRSLPRQFLFTRGTQIFVDGLLVALAFVFSYFVRFDGLPRQFILDQMLLVLPLVVLVYLACNYLWGIYSFIWRLTSLSEAVAIGQSIACSALFLLSVRIVIQNSMAEWTVPIGVLIVHPVVAYVAIVGIRVLRRLQHRYFDGRRTMVPCREVRRLLLVGAGQTGARLASELQRRRRDLHIVAFVDDDAGKQNRRVHGIPVVGTTLELPSLLLQKKVDEVVLCMPRATGAKRRQIVGVCETAAVRTTTVPSLGDIVLDRLDPSQLRPVRMEDLLGRDSVGYTLDEEARSLFRDRRILITGAAGSIGSELSRQLSFLQPSELILLDRDENGLYEIGLEIREELEGNVVQIVADIRDSERLQRIFERGRPEVIFHAAAYKHVPMMEQDPGEAVLNNVVGTRNLVDLANRFQALSFVLISTDKAVNPTSIMGATKRIAELIVCQDQPLDSTTRFCCVRFGNVLGSRASVVPIFQKRITQGKNLQVTHPEIRRYFMTIPEAVQLVVQAGSIGGEGEIFLLDMGDPVKIVDLARELIELSGLVPDEDIAIEYTGLRKGEKLFEELLVNTERGDSSTRYPKVFVARGENHGRSLSGFKALMEDLVDAAYCGDDDAILHLLESFDIGYGAGRASSDSGSNAPAAEGLEDVAEQVGPKTHPMPRLGKVTP